MKAKEGYKVMREAQQIWDELLQHHVIRNVCIDVEKEEVKKGMRTFEKSSDKVKKKRIKKVSKKVSYLNKRGTVWAKSQQAEQMHAMRQCHSTLTKIIHLENIGQLDTI